MSAVSVEQGMIVFRYPTPYQDSIAIAPQRDTVQSGIPLPDDGDSTLGYLNPEPVLIRQPGIRVPVVQSIQEEKPQQTIAAKRPTRDTWNTSGDFLHINGLSDVIMVARQQEKPNSPVFQRTEKPKDIQPLQRVRDTNDWLLGVFLFLVVLFVWIRIFYSKFFNLLANALISFQISAKLFQERNVLLQRVSIVLDFIYLLVFSIFVYELAHFLDIGTWSIHGFNFYLLLLNIIMLYALFRRMVLRLTGELFLIRSLFAEYLHHTFVINKGAGILLFPVVIMAHYLPHALIPVILIIGVVIYAVAFLLKGIRAYQIIIRRDVLLFYLILYFCTLEILPLLLGYKFVTSLIQSN